MRISGIIFAMATVLAAGCVSDNTQNASLVLRKNQAPNADCTLSGEDSGSFIARGVIDVSLANQGYVLTPLLQLRTVAFDMADPLQRAVSLGGAEIAIEGADPFTQRFAGIIEPQQSFSVSFIAVPDEVVDSVGAGLAPGDVEQVVAEIRVFGDLGGGEIESNRFDYPVDICNECLRINAGSCAGFAPSGNQLCFPGQDIYGVECCTSSTTGELVCPGVPEEPPA